MPIDWHRFHASEFSLPEVVDSRRRMWICLIAFLLLLAIVFVRAVQLEVMQGAAFRAEAARPLRRETSLPGTRGRILARDGTVLACDKLVRGLAVHYRMLEDPADSRWLRRSVRRRLSRAQRNDPDRVEAERSAVLAERRQLAARLAKRCGIPLDEWDRRAGRIQARVERIAASVRRRHGSEITIAEQEDFHIMAQELPPALAAELEAELDAELDADAAQLPPVKIVSSRRRDYPLGSLAAHILGHLGAVGRQELDDRRADYRADDFVGRAGLERQYESSLRGRRGTAVELTNHSGAVLASYHEREPRQGCELVLTLDVPLQRAAESLLDAAIRRRSVLAGQSQPAGGAIVVMDISSGAIRAAASAPRFDPNVFASGNSDQRAELLAASTKPLFDRVCRMALPPGSIVKIVSAAALLESGTVDPQEAFHYCRQIGAEPLLRWAARFGLGRPTAIDLPGEAAGTLPQNTCSPFLLAIGQGPITVTPLQVVRMMAAVANGGTLVTPHVVERAGSSGKPSRVPPPKPIAGLSPQNLAAIRQGLERAVADPQGTAHATVFLPEVAIAGQTGTAACGDRLAHAWFAGYVPADDPQLAIAVALEHAGNATAGPVAKRLVLKMHQLRVLQ